MKAFMFPDALKPRKGTSASTAKHLDCGGLLPGVDDIPYVSADFLLDDVFVPVEGEPRYATAVQPGHMTVWQLTTEESLALASGHLLTILSFSKEQPVLYPTITEIPLAQPEMPLLNVLARALVATIHSSEDWDEMGEEERDDWRKGVHKVVDVLEHYKARAAFDKQHREETDESA
jgi:hypothetical protein